VGVLNAGAMAMKGEFDWVSAYGTIDLLAEQVGGLPDLEIVGDGLFTTKHLHANAQKADLQDKIDAARALLDEANQLCQQVAAGL
jgi:hypothetical protein